jgi:hypothetical protein
MYTIVETADFKANVKKCLTEDERLAFFTYLSKNPFDGVVISGGGGLRKIRWSTAGTGKSGGVRIIYYNLLEDGEIYAVDIYAKTQKENLTQKELNKLKGEKHD